MTQEEREVMETVEQYYREERARKKEEAEKERKRKEAEKKKREKEEREIQKAVAIVESETQRKRLAQMIRTGGEATESLSAFNETFCLPPIDTNDPQQIADRTVEYFNICAKYDVKPGLEGLCLALGMHRTTFFRIERGDVVKSKEVQAVFKQAHQMLSAQMEHYMLHGKINPASGIFILKNNYGYKDTTENIVVTEQEEKTDAEAIRKKWLLK